MIRVARAHIILLMILSLMLGIGGTILVTGVVSNPGTPPDWTVEPCSLWATDAKPVLPPFTVTDACVEPNGNISVPNLDHVDLPTK